MLGVEVSLQPHSAAVAQKWLWPTCELIKVAVFQTDLFTGMGTGLDLTMAVVFWSLV